MDLAESLDECFDYNIACCASIFTHIPASRNPFCAGSEGGMTFTGVMIGYLQHYAYIVNFKRMHINTRSLGWWGALMGVHDA
jgi:hypothetical protein